MKLIGLAGKARSGKDTIADIWANERRVSRYALADPVRHAAAAMFNMQFEQFTGDNPNRDKIDPFWGISPRRMIQLVGTECGREVFRPDIWTKNAEMRLRACRELNHFASLPSDYFIVTDIRFNDEADWIRKQGGRVIHILRNNDPEVEAHKSENGVDIVTGDLAIHNTGSLGNLKLTVQNTIFRIEEML